MRYSVFTLLTVVIFAFASAATAQPPAKEKPGSKPKADPKAKLEPESEFNMKLTVSDIILGQQVYGEKVTKDDLKNRVVLVDYWGINCPPCLALMPRTAELNTELSDFGLLILGSHRQGGEADKVRAVALQHRANFPISQATFVRGSEDSRILPHCILFDHTGKCIFRGHPNVVDGHIRKAVGAALVANAGREKFSSTVESVIKELKAGKSPQTLLARVSSMSKFKGDAGVDAKALLAAMTAGGRKKLDAAKEISDTDPVAAFELVEKLPTTYKGSPLAQEATELISKLRKQKAVTSELAARHYFENIKKLDQQLGLGAEDPRKPEFQKSRAPLLKQLKDKVAVMKKTWPDAKVTKEALETADRYAVEIK